MGRIFVGLCQVGAWGCFDEFNRLEERMLSAVSQQIQTIQEALKDMSEKKEKSKRNRSPLNFLGILILDSSNEFYVHVQCRQLEVHIRINTHLFAASTVVELIGKQVKVNSDMAVFITMNPGYAGRSNLPDNLKKLFRSLAMTKPDRQLIAEVMLYSQGFRMAEKLAMKIVPFFK